MMFDHKQSIELQIQTIVFVTSHKKGKNAKSISIMWVNEPYVTHDLLRSLR